MRIPTHPGVILKEELSALDISANAFAKALCVPANRVSEIIRGRRGVSAETALRLAAYFGNTPEFWLRLQNNHDLGKARAESGAAIKKQVRKAA